MAAVAVKSVELTCATCREPWTHIRPRGKGGRNPATNPSHPKCKQKRDNLNRAMSRARNKEVQETANENEKADALDIAWRGGDLLEEVQQFEEPPEPYDTRQETEKQVHAEIVYSTAEDRMAVALWFLDSREAKTGPETGRTIHARPLRVIGSARPWWWQHDPVYTQAPMKRGKPFTMGS